MSNVLHDTPPSKLHRTLTIGPFVGHQHNPREGLWMIKGSKICLQQNLVLVKFENPRIFFFLNRYFHMLVIAGETAAPNSLTSFTPGRQKLKQSAIFKKFHGKSGNPRLVYVYVNFPFINFMNWLIKVHAACLNQSLDW